MTTVLQAVNAVTTIERDGDVAIVTIDSPPVNALSHVVRCGIVAAFEALAQELWVKAAVLICAGRTFFVGADIAELGKPEREPGFPAMLDTVERAGFPVIAAIHGTALGGGLELALCCSHRVALASSTVGLPEVKLGVLPGAGGTQRLPRLVGVERALEMMVTGEQVLAARAMQDGLLDAVLPEDLRAGAVEFARAAARKAPLQRVRDRDDRLAEARARPELFDRFRKANARHFRGLEAPERILTCVEAALTQPFEAGLALERRLFAELVAGDQSAALRHVFRAERLAPQPDRIAGVEALPVARVGVLGAGTMGRGIAMSLANAGVPVVIADASADAAAKGFIAMGETWRASAAKGRFSAEEAEARLARVTVAETVEGFADCDLIIEAVYEDMEVKIAVFGMLDRVARPDAILASNTSYLDVNRIAAATGRPDRVLGLHFFSPAHVMKLVEVVRGGGTSDAVLATAFALARRTGKVAVLSEVCHGFIGNRMLEQRQDEALRLILEGVRPWDVDRVATEFGFPMGPFAMHDLAGLDLGWSAETSRGETIRDLLCEAGRRGQKTGAGFFDYGPDRKPQVSDAVEQLVRDFASRQGIADRAAADAEVLDRLVLPMVNEGARILEENVATRASDIDVVWIHGYGWPRWMGGPMFWAERQGLTDVVARLEALAAVHGPRFVPSDYLRRAALAGAWEAV